VLLSFANDGILCPATFIGEIFVFEFDVENLLKKENLRGIEFPQKPEILADSAMYFKFKSSCPLYS